MTLNTSWFGNSDGNHSGTSKSRIERSRDANEDDMRTQRSSAGWSELEFGFSGHYCLLCVRLRSFKDRLVLCIQDFQLGSFLEFAVEVATRRILPSSNRLDRSRDLRLDLPSSSMI